MLKFGFRLLEILQVVSRLCLCSYFKADEEFPFPLCTFWNHKHRQVCSSKFDPSEGDILYCSPCCVSDRQWESTQINLVRQHQLQLNASLVQCYRLSGINVYDQCFRVIPTNLLVCLAHHCLAAMIGCQSYCCFSINSPLILI